MEEKKPKEETNRKNHWFSRLEEPETPELLDGLEYMNVLLSLNGKVKLHTPNEAFRIEGKTLVKYVGRQEEVAIPPGVEIIGEKAFSDLRLCNVIIPDTVKEIKAGAFINCDPISRINLPAGLEYIGEKAFAWCVNLSEMSIPQGVTELPDKVFLACSNLKKVTFPSSLKKIGAYCFAECASLKSIQVPDISSIEEGTFAYCSSLNTIKLPETVTEISDHSFYCCSSLSALYLPDSVKRIGESAFGLCLALDIVCLENKQTKIHKTAFYQALWNPSFPSVKEEEGFLISGAKLIKYIGNSEQIQIPEGVKEIGEKAFHHNKMKELTLPESVEKIGICAFESCVSLTKINFSTGLKEIPTSCFWGCRSLEEVAIPHSVLRIENLAFAYCTKLSKVKLERADVIVKEDAFSGTKWDGRSKYKNK